MAATPPLEVSDGLRRVVVNPQMLDAAHNPVYGVLERLLWRINLDDDVVDDFALNGVVFVDAHSSSKGASAWSVWQALQYVNLVTVRIDRRMLMAVRDRLAAIVSIAVQDVLKLGRAANLARQRRVAVALAEKRLDARRDRSPIGSVIRNDDFVLIAEILVAIKDELLDPGTRLVALVVSAPDKLSR
jgi:hypothetical protein